MLYSPCSVLRTTKNYCWVEIYNSCENFGLEFNPSESELFRAIPKCFSEPIRKTFRISFDEKCSKINPSPDSFGLMPRIEAEWIGLLIKKDTKHFLDRFTMSPNGSETDFRICNERDSKRFSDWIGFIWIEFHLKNYAKMDKSYFKTFRNRLEINPNQFEWIRARVDLNRIFNPN